VYKANIVYYDTHEIELLEEFMKVLSLIILVTVLGINMTSCATSQSQTQFVHNPVIEFAPLTFSDYTVLGRVSGSGSVVEHIRLIGSNTFIGDTGRYGSLGALTQYGSMVHESVTVFEGGGRISTNNIRIPFLSRSRPTTARDIAISNATYSMIEMANMLNADAVIFVTTSVQTIGSLSPRTITANVTVNGIAVRLNTPN
jgi:hypothetical protein